MKVLFVHNNFPAQYRNIAAALARESCFELVAVGGPTSSSMPSVRLIRYALPEADVSRTHPFARRFDVECRRAEQVLYSISSLATSGFTPDLILAHPGWGETLPLRTIFPKARLLVYCEFFYGPEGRDIGFDPEFPMPGLDGHIGLQLKNATTLLALEDCEMGISPTSWQHSTFPKHYQGKIEVIHEGIDTARMRPNPEARLTLANGLHLRPSDEVVTFVARNLEPLRGYHIFMRALPKILKRRPNAHIIIIGGNGAPYGLAPPTGTTWKSMCLDEVRDQLDLSHVHFVGGVSYEALIATLQVSSAHVYFTYPFVLSWSMLEAMSAGCLVIGSDTAPVREIIRSGENGFLIPFFEVDELAGRVIEALAHPTRFCELRTAARHHIVDHYDAEQVCIPRMRLLLDQGREFASSNRVSPKPARRTSRRMT
ncbi:glycosyl transferase family 1 [Bradyrhizobium sp. AC87j1]|uniref:glycosyltransferase n=1 Tax=Bradyrhizobium sp. AC87j1 TaxID=2055894 RepID=UPI000CECA2C7|nr:glycosyltransferase [Bradyrhizobium sp. AC87j1]PPQ14336.1 glycosyl transferase family 1 [Bradyrhizobium sp. AC87j1]